MTPDAFRDAHPGIERVELVVLDPNGVERGKRAPVAALGKAFDGGVNFPLSLHALDLWGTEVAETGLHIASGDRDGFFRAVPGTLCVLPGGGAQVVLETWTANGAPFAGCSRQVLRAAVDRLAAQDLHATCAFELEFHLLEPSRPGEEPRVADVTALGASQRMYELEPLRAHAAVLGAIEAAGEAAGLPIDTIVKEAAPGQYEVNLHHRGPKEGGALRAADDAVVLRRIVRAAAHLNGLVATFMAKPFADTAGNGAHVHVSLADGAGVNAFTDVAVLERGAAGLVATMAEATLVFAANRNGFRRLQPGSYAPTRAVWGHNNRSVAVRVPASPPLARRLEHRVAGADANPYLVLAAVLEGIRAGLEADMEPPAPVDGNAYEGTAGEALPSSLEAALALWDGSAFARTAMGETMHRNLAHLRRAEIERFRGDISPLERATFL